jgi:hypothetical protein
MAGTGDVLIEFSVFRNFIASAVLFFQMSGGDVLLLVVRFLDSESDGSSSRSAFALKMEWVSE